MAAPKGIQAVEWLSRRAKQQRGGNERGLSQASQITRPILESFQRWLWRYTKPNGQRLGWSTQRNRLGILKDWFRWMTG